ncbi:MAG: lytic transglycosylase F [Desulfobacterales bacterium]|nr:lytic transglycosylase F [Desulfobacterales bacterium]
MQRLRRALVLAAMLVGAVIVPPCPADGPPTSQTLVRSDKPLMGDLDAMVARRAIRALVAYSKTYYFLDGGEQRGLSYELLQEFEKFLNRKFKTGTLKIHVIIIPVARDELLPALVEGRGDLAVANLTITDERRRVVDFSAPFLKNVSEIVVSGAMAAPLTRLEDFAGRLIEVRRSSSYYESLLTLNERLEGQGLAPVRIELADENLEDEDLLEMVNAGLLPAIVMDSHKAHFWQQIFPDITLQEAFPLRTDGEIAWAMRPRSPQLKKVVNEFAREHKKGTLLGNIIFKRYLKNTRWVRNALSEQELAKYNAVVGLFAKYAARYNFDHLMITAQAYQESGLDHSKVSPAGAVGIMQLLPSTAASKSVGISDIRKLENNIHAGVRYLRHIHDVYLADEPMDALNKTLFAFAAYNAGPSRIMQLRREAARQGLDPNRWFHHVENIVAKRVGRETVQYVGNIYKYYIAYRLAAEKIEHRKNLREVKEAS